MKSAVIIDVREPKEFKDFSIPGAINLPSTAFRPEQYADYSEQVICLVCQTGNRALKIQKKLESSGFKQVSVMAMQMEHIIEKQKKQSGWTVDRQFRLLVGILIALSLTGFLVFSSWSLIVSGIVSAGLIFTALIDRCYLRQLVAMMPWNKDRK